MISPLSLSASDDERTRRYTEVLGTIDALMDGEDDWIAAMATVASELHHAFAYYDWTGFYRAVSADLLIVGPYQGGHGCLRIENGRGVCGVAATSKTTQLVPDVDAIPHHIACSTSTRSEIVVPVLRQSGTVLAVLDVDSNTPEAFRGADQVALESLCLRLGQRFG